MTATPSFHDFSLTDLLDSLLLNPWFERWRRFGFIVCVAASLFCFSATIDFEVHCEPTIYNESGIPLFTRPIAEKVNTRCKNKSELVVIRCSGWMMLLSSLEVLAYSSYWLIRHQTINVFRTFAKARDLIETCNVTLLSIKALMGSPLEGNEAIASNDEKRYKIREASRLLTLMKPKTNVRTQYLMRNLLLSMTLTVGMLETVWAIWKVDSKGDEFECSVYSSGISRNYTCAHSIGEHTIFSWDAFGLGSLVQVGMTICSIWIMSVSWFIVCITWIVLILSVCLVLPLGLLLIDLFDHLNENSVIAIFVFAPCIFPIILVLWKMICKFTRCFWINCCCCYKHLHEDDEIEMVSAKFLSVVWELSHPSNSGVMTEFTDFLFSENYRNSLEDKVEEILQSRDVELLQIRRKISKKSFSAAINTFPRIGDVSIEYFNAIACNVDYRVEECKEFMLWALKEEMWALFIIFLNNAKGTLPATDVDIKGICQNMNLNFNSYGVPVFMSHIPEFHETVEYEHESSSGAVGNLLYYALDSKFGEKKQGPYKIMKFILNVFQPQHFFVHYSHKDVHGDFSFGASEYLGIEREELLKRGVNAEALMNLEESLNASNASSTFQYKCQQEIETFFQKYKEITDNHENHDNLRELANDLVGKKFLTWDDKAKKFLAEVNKKAMRSNASESHWRVLIALLSAYIVTGTRQLDCQVKLPHEYDKISCLVKAMLWKSTLGYFPRACQHLISISSIHFKNSIVRELKKYMENEFAQSLLTSSSLQSYVTTIYQNERERNRRSAEAQSSSSSQEGSSRHAESPFERDADDTARPIP